MDKDVEPATREDDIVPCRATCPANIDIPSYLRLVTRGNVDEANCVIREKVPFPGVLGRVCFHPCEDACRRVQVNNEPLSICALKRYAADNENGLWKQSSMVKPATNKKVAILGAGPAGLTAAFYLKKQGHDITLFDEREKAGGMLRYGIPAYRLPNAVLDNEINDILDLGVEFEPGKKLGDNVTIEQLESDGYDAVFLAIGLQKSIKIEVPGSDHEDVLWGVEFLAAVAKGDAPELEDRVLVIGGGNVAIDVALSALRCKVKNVTMICLESKGEMPASPWEIEDAIHEGVKIEPSWGPEEIIIENNAITGMRFKQCTAVFDDKGSFCPVFSDEKMELEGDQIIMAIGQAADISFLPKDNSIKSDRGLIAVDLETYETSRKGFYAGGDGIMPPAGSVIEAIAAGRKAAASIDKQLGGDGEIDEILLSDKTPDPYIGKIDGFAELKRVAVPVIPLEGRNNGFDEVSLGYDKELATAEARRCLQCDLRLDIGSNPSVPENIFAMTAENIETVPDTSEGVYQLYDNDRNVIAIKGTATIRDDLFDRLENNENAAFFDYEEDPMFSKRESEMISHYLQEHGELPRGGSDELDDLF
ncbi:MAG: FAD-dependent oxidoreductase [Deltaproteobacteria bacterium]|nr:FAD-dependent oxidoreductase [Deltaproteobacteria bacterium]